MKKNWKSLSLSAIWAASLLAGVFILINYSATSGATGLLAKHLPSASHLSRPSSQPTFLVFAHPYCPCSSASIGELERLLPRLRGKVDIKVIFIQPRGRSEEWVHGPLWQKAEGLPDVTVTIDTEGKMAESFGATTSGQAFLYDADGALIFSGGITPARGHMGDSRGRDFVISWLEGDRTQGHLTQVFGCALKNNPAGPEVSQ